MNKSLKKAQLALEDAQEAADIAKKDLETTQAQSSKLQQVKWEAEVWT